MLKVNYIKKNELRQIHILCVFVVLVCFYAAGAVPGFYGSG